MSRVMTVLVLIAMVGVFVEPCSAQSGQAKPAPAVQAPPAAAVQTAPVVNAPKVSRAAHASHSRSDLHNHWHNNDYYTPTAGYYPYSIPYTYGYGGYGGYYPYGGIYSNYGYPVNLNSGLERGYLWGNTYINPNFGN